MQIVSDELHEKVLEASNERNYLKLLESLGGLGKLESMITKEVDDKGSDVERMIAEVKILRNLFRNAMKEMKEICDQSKIE